MEFKKMLKAKMEEQSALLNKALAENRAMTPEEQTTMDSLEVEIKNLEKSIEAQEKIDTRTAANAAPINEPIPAEPKGNPTVENITRGIFGSVGGYFQAVHKSKNDPTAVEKLAKLNSEVLKIVNAAGMNESVPADGGVLVGTDISTVLLQQSIEQSKLMSRIFELPVSQNSNSVSLPIIDDDEIEMYWDGEADLITGTKPKMGSVDMKLKNLNGLIYVTNDLLEDAASLEAFIMKKFPEKQSKKLDKAIIAGTGAGMPQGIKTAPALISVAKETGQAARTIVAQNIINMYARFDGNDNTAVWVANRNTLPQLCQMGIVVGNGGMLVYMPPNGLADRPNGALMGIPLILLEYCETLGTAGDIMLVDLSQYIMAKKSAMKIAPSMHVRFEYNEMAYRFTYRADGQPAKKKARTPDKGADTVSPFVALATRA